MSDPAPQFVPVPSGSRRRLWIAVAMAGGFGLVAVLLLRPRPAAIAPRPVAAETAPVRATATRRPVATSHAGAIELLRRAADRFVDARRDAVRSLEAAEASGADPRVLSAFAGLLGVPLAHPPPAEPPADARPSIRDRTDDPPRAL